MKKYLLILLVLALVIPPSVASASDVTDAEYIGVITVTNNGTAVSNVSVNVSISTADWITAGILNSEANNIVARNASGEDIAVMPGYGGNPWIFFVGDLAANSNTNIYLYTGEVSGGKVAYFPDTNGMTVEDAPTLECGNYFTLEADVGIDTTAGVSKYIFYKDGAFNVRVSQYVSENITASMNGSDNTSPTSFSDPGSTWSAETFVYDNDVGTYGYCSVNPSSWGTPLTLNVASTPCNAIQFNADVYTPAVDKIKIDVYYDSGWHNIYEGPVTDDDWAVKTLGGTYDVTSANVTFFNGDGGSARNESLNEFDFIEVTSLLSLTATGIESGEHKTEVRAITGNMWLLVDDAVKAAGSLAGNYVADNDYDWVICKGNAVYWMEYVEITVGGVQKGYWEWEYSATFTDQSGNGNTATPTFRTTSSDADVTAVLSSFRPASQASASPDLVSQWPEMISEVPAESETMYTEESRPGIFFEPLVHAVWPLSGIPETFFWYNFTFFTVIFAGILVFRMHPSLILKCIVMGAIMIFWALPGPNVYGMFTVIYFALFSFGIVVLSRSYGW